MILTMLGNTGPYPAPGGACSGYLLENEGKRIILDLGPGTLANYLTVGEIEEIDMIILSHLHGDHMADLLVLRYALEMKGLRLPLYAPDSPAEDFERLTYKDAFDVKVLTEETAFSFAGLDFSFSQMLHPYKDMAVKVTDGKTTFMYTGDTADCMALRKFVGGVDVLLCDTAFLEDVNSDKHLSLDQAIAVANEAGVRRLIMTHFNPEISPEKYYQAGAHKFKGRLSKATPLNKVDL